MSPSLPCGNSDSICNAKIWSPKPIYRKNTLNLTEKDNSFMICYQAFIMANVLPSLSVIQPNVDWINSCMIPVKNQCLI